MDKKRLANAAPDLYDALRECLALLREIDSSDITLTEHAGYVALAKAESNAAYRTALIRYGAACEKVAS